MSDTDTQSDTYSMVSTERQKVSVSAFWSVVSVTVGITDLHTLRVGNVRVRDAHLLLDLSFSSFFFLDTVQSSYV